VEEYLHDHIPLAAAMGTSVRVADIEGVVLSVPLRPNVNFHSTAFGGSVAAQGILAGWTLVHVRLEHQGIQARTVIQRSDVAYLEPIHEDFEVHTLAVDADAWQRFLVSLARWGRARIRVASEVRCRGVLVARVKGDYVALGGEGEDD
jgi:thioesterase domain-containing protein